MLRLISASFLLIVALEAHAISFRDLFGRLTDTTGGSNASIELVLDKISEKENKSLPRVINQDIRLDKVAAGQGPRYVYYYTVLNDLSAEENAARFRTAIAPNLKSQVCGDKNLKMFLKNRVTVSYTYRTQDGQEIGRVDVSPTDCGYTA